MLFVPLVELIGNPLRQPFHLIQLMAELEIGFVELIHLVLAVQLLFLQGREHALSFFFFSKRLVQFSSDLFKFFSMADHGRFEFFHLPLSRQDPAEVLGLLSTGQDPAAVHHVAFEGHEALVFPVLLPGRQGLVQISHKSGVPQKDIHHRFVGLRRFHELP